MIRYDSVYDRLFEDKNYKWTLLNLDNEILLLEKYQVKTFPDYVIIGKNGKIDRSCGTKFAYNYIKNKETNQTINLINLFLLYLDILFFLLHQKLYIIDNMIHLFFYL
mgnify:CR=1 FL=1